MGCPPFSGSRAFGFPTTRTPFLIRGSSVTWALILPLPTVGILRWTVGTVWTQALHGSKNVKEKWGQSERQARHLL